MKFEVQQRASVPGIAAQGVIVDATETVTGFPVYTLRWLDEAGETHTGTVGEGDLAKANPSDDDLMDAAEAKAAGEDAIECIVNLRVASKLADLARARRKASRASASKRKR